GRRSPGRPAARWCTGRRPPRCRGTSRRARARGGSCAARSPRRLRRTPRSCPCSRVPARTPRALRRPASFVPCAWTCPAPPGLNLAERGLPVEQAPRLGGAPAPGRPVPGDREHLEARAVVEGRDQGARDVGPGGGLDRRTVGREL